MIVFANESNPQTIQEAKASPFWDKWKEVIRIDLSSLLKRGVFCEIQEMPISHTHVGYRWVFVWKRNDKGEVICCKARFVAQGFTQRFGIDYIDTYSLIMDATSFRWLLYFTVQRSLHTHLMDVVTVYLYGDLDKDIYMKIPDGLCNSI